MEQRPSTQTGARLSAASWRVLFLLGLSIFINCVDRGNLSIAAPAIQQEFHLSESQLGILLSSYLWFYMLFQLPAGWLIDRFNVNWILGVGFLLWSGATTMTGFLHGFISLLLIRLFLGATESVAYPSYGKIFAVHFPEERRGIANAFISIGQATGPAFATFAGGFAIIRFGWRPFFIVLGLAGIPWILGWVSWAPRQIATKERERKHSPGTMYDVLKQSSAWGTGIGTFFANYNLYLLITWLPFYLVHERHFSLTLTGEVAAGVFLLKAVSAVLSGHLSDRWIASGASPNVVYKVLLCLGALGGLFLVPCALVSASTCTLLLLASGALLGLGSPHFFTVSQSLAGPRLAASWTSLQLFVATSGSILAPILTGFIVQRAGGFLWAFVPAGAAACAEVLCWLFIVGPIRRVVWQAIPRTSDAPV